MKPEDKIILRCVLDLYQKSFDIQDTLSNEAANAEELCSELYELFVRINPVTYVEEELWEDYRERTIKHIEGAK
jgi:hypothetical protein